MLPDAPEFELTADESLDRLQERLTECEAELAQREAEFDRLNDEPKRRAARRRDIPKQRATVRKQLDELQRQLDAEPRPDELPELALARRTHLQAKAQALQETLDGRNQ